MATWVIASELAKYRVTKWRRRRVLSAGSPWEPRGSWHGARGGHEPHVNWPIASGGNSAPDAERRRGITQANDACVKPDIVGRTMPELKPRQQVHKCRSNHNRSFFSTSRARVS